MVFEGAMALHGTMQSFCGSFTFLAAEKPWPGWVLQICLGMPSEMLSRRMAFWMFLGEAFEYLTEGQGLFSWRLRYNLNVALVKML